MAANSGLTADNGGTGAEAALPASVTDHGHGVGAVLLIVAGQKRAADEGFLAEQVEIVAGNHVSPEALAASVETETHGKEAVCGQRGGSGG